jgi:AcrR family transcriptional regulator
MAQRLSRPERTAANHAAVLTAARTVFLREGYHGASVEQVAAEAGFTIGAVYSRFRSKADLFLSLLAERIDERGVQLRALAVDVRNRPDGGDPVGRVEEPATAVARQWAAILHTDLPWTLLVIEFRVHAARHPELAARFAEQHERLLDVVAEVVTAMLGPAAVSPERARDVARAGLAMGPGVALARAAEGEAFTDDLIQAMHAAVAARLIGP